MMMMMTMIPLMATLLIMGCFPSYLYLLSILGMTVLVLSVLKCPSLYLGVDYFISKWISVGSVSWVLLFLSAFLTLTMIFAIPTSGPVPLLLHSMMVLTLLLSFSMKKMLMFYISFELSLIPISILVMGSGYQPERLEAFFYMFIYTAGASLPLLVVILMMLSHSQVTMFFELEIVGIWEWESWLKNIVTISLITGFLVKFPMYGLHFWLPKAHVEAPVGGSMILAGLLLKLGGFGLIMLSPLLMISKLTTFISSFSLTGGALIAILCMSQVDMKVLIAYSSVSHLSLAIATILMKTMFSIMMGVLILIAHGISSPGLFYGAYVLYLRSHSRNMLLNSGSLTYLPIFSLWWFILAMGNMSAPPMLNLVGELMSVVAAIGVSYYFFIQTSAMVFLGGVYTLILYSSTQQGQKPHHLSGALLVNARESLNFFSLCAPMIFMVVMINFIY